MFWHPAERRQVESGTGTADPATAAARAPDIYAEAIRKGTHVGRRRCVDDGGPMSTSELGKAWLNDARAWLDPGTIEDYAMRVETFLAKAFPSILDVNTARLKRYIGARLGEVKATTVRKDMSAVRGLLAWCKERGKLADVPEVPGVPKRVLGTAYERPSRAPAPELSPEEIKAFLAALPDVSERASTVTGYRFLVRPRFEFGYETGLRPGTLDKLSVPEHWAPGEHVLRLPARSLKQRRDNLLPLTARAREILECWAPRWGLIFGSHDYRNQVIPAAEEALPEHKRQAFCAAHLRSARITHNLDEGMAPTAVQRLATHSSLATTAKYARESFRIAEAELRRLGKL